MASFTRKAIMDSFMKLVDQRPISKITIKESMNMVLQRFRR